MCKAHPVSSASSTCAQGCNASFPDPNTLGMNFTLSSRSPYIRAFTIISVWIQERSGSEEQESPQLCVNLLVDSSFLSEEQTSFLRWLDGTSAVFRRHAAPILEVWPTLIAMSDDHSNWILTRYSRPLGRGYPRIISMEKKKKSVDFLRSAFWTLMFTVLSCFSLLSICHGWLVKNASKGTKTLPGQGAWQRGGYALYLAPDWGVLKPATV